jgi:hypothetical protein
VVNMIACTECNKEVSRTAYMCPHCEHVSMDALALHNRRLSWLAAGLLIVAIVMATFVAHKPMTAHRQLHSQSHQQ